MSGLRFLSGLAVALACGFTSMVADPAHAAPLDPQACEQLQLKLDDLRKFGVETDMALGAEAARTTLPAERFNRIGVYIETDEQLNFRCGLAKQRIVLPTTIEGGEEEIPAPGEKSAAGSPGAPPVPQRAPRPTTDAAATLTVVPKTPAAASKAPDAAPKRRPAAAKAKEASTAPGGATKASTSAPRATPTPKPAATDGDPPKAAKKKSARKSDDAYRPTAKPPVREEQTPPAAKQ